MTYTPDEIRLAVAIAKRRHCQIANLVACAAIEPECDLSTSSIEYRSIHSPIAIKRHWLAAMMSWSTSPITVYEPTGEVTLTQVGIRIIRKQGGTTVHRVMSEQAAERLPIQRWGTHGPRLIDLERQQQVDLFIASHKPVKARTGRTAAQIAGYQRQRERLVAEARERRLASVAA